MAFVRTEVEQLTFNPFTKIGKEWFLLTSGTPDCYNTMTASWGQMGVLWGKNVLTAYVRTSRKTFELIERNVLVYIVDNDMYKFFFCFDVRAKFIKTFLRKFSTRSVNHIHF